MQSWKNILSLFKTLKTKRKIQIIFLMFSSLLTGALEAISLASFLPFLSVLINPDSLIKLQLYKSLGIISKSSVENPSLFTLTIIFVLLSFAAALIRLLNLWYAARISGLIGSDVGVNVYKKCLYQPYLKQLMGNSSMIINAVTYQSPNVLGVFYSANFIITSSFIFLSLLFGLISLNFKLTLSILALISLSYFFISFSIRRLLIRNSKIVENYGKKQIQTLQEGIGLIRDIILENSYNIFIEKFRFFDRELNLRKSEIKFYSTFPRFLLEFVAITFLALVALIMTKINNQNTLLPVFGTYALGAQKLISAAQQIYTNWSTVEAKSADIKKILSIVNSNSNYENKIYDSVPKYIFKKSIDLDKVRFNYPNAKKKAIFIPNLQIKRGEKIAIIGTTGSGKSTLVDLIMGLIEPSEGNIFIDGELLNHSSNTNHNKLISWRKAISHVPQSIFLADATFKENIALGIPSHLVDFKRLKNAAKIACIDNFIEKFPETYNGCVGERGLRLSGGQKQRIGLARAIYKQPKILILDEATSALDNLTESKVMSSISSTFSDITIIMITHRHNSIRNFDRVLKIEDGELLLDDAPDKVLFNM